MGNKTIDVNNVDGIVNAENGVVINQYFYYDTSKNNDSIDNKKFKKIEEYPFYRSIEKDKYICQKGQISIESNLPKVNFPMSFLIECEISFKLENNKTIIIKLDNEATLKELFSLYMYCFEDKDEQNNKMITYTSNHVTLDISIGTFNTLIYIANDLQEVYTERINKLEEKLESKEFLLSKEYKNGFELCEISYKLFIKIQQFMQKHIIYRTSNIGEWDIFMDSNDSYFIWTKDDVIINTSIKYNYDIDVEEPISIMLVWDILNFVFYRKDAVEILTVKETYRWFTEILIPKVEEEIIGSMDKEVLPTRSFKCESDNEYINQEFKFIDTIICNSELFFRHIVFNKDNLKNLYEGLLILLKNSKKLDINGLTRLFNRIGNINTIPLPKLKNIPLGERNNVNYTKEYFINRTNVELEEINKGDMSMDNLLGGKPIADSNFIINEIFNCYIVIFRTNGEDDYSSIIIHEVYQKLKIFEKVSTVYSTREKMMMPFWD